MISNVFTYSKYPRPPGFSTPARSETVDRGDQGQQQEPVKVNKARTKGKPVAKPLAQHVVHQQLNDMVERLNMKSPYFQSQVTFRMDDKKQPGIVMVDLKEDNVINRYAPEDMLDLERSLYDMAGFQFSFEA